MNRDPRAFLFGVAGSVMLCAAVACTSNNGPPACSALAACCSFTDDPSSCSETATNGSLTDAACGAELALYQEHGQCPADSGPVASGDAGRNASGDATRD